MKVSIRLHDTITKLIDLLTSLSGPVPVSLATVIKRTDAPDVKDPPKKRRKLTDRAPRSLSELKGVSENGVPNGFIPIARVNLHLVRDKALCFNARAWIDFLC